MQAGHGMSRLRDDRSDVAAIRPAVDGRIRVQDFAPASRARKPDPVVVVRSRREVGDDGDRACPVAAEAKPREDRICAVRDLDPSKPRCLAIALVQRALASIQPVAVADDRLHAAVRGHVERCPVEFALEVPFGRLRELLSHEQELLARIRPHESEICA
jgi:hypothetical protein